jgi:hypothetical protein
MYAHNLRNSRPKRPTPQQPVLIKQETPPSEPSVAHNLIDRLKQINNDSINDTQLLPTAIPHKNEENASQIISEKINEIRVRRSQSVDLLKKRLPPPIPEKSLTQREIAIKSSSSIYPIVKVRRRMSRTEVSRTPQITPPPIPPKPLKNYLTRRKDQK